MEMVYEQPDQVQKIMAEVIVVRAELLFATMKFEYVALSKHFKEVEPEVSTPSYKCTISGDRVRFEEC